MQDLEGRVAVITGGGSGIGEGIAIAAAEQSMHVVVADIEVEQAERVAEAVRAQGVRALAVRADVSDRDSVEALADAAYGEFGEVNLLCNNAGVLVMTPFAEMSAQDLRWMLDVNLFGVLHGIQAFLPRMQEQAGEAHIVNTASMSGLVTGRAAGLSGYAATKFGVVGLTEALQLELAPTGVTLSLFCPGSTATQISSAQRNRQEAYGAAKDRPPADRPPPGRRTDVRADVQQQPIDVGRAVIEGVREGRPYILTHPDPRPLVEQRMQALLSAFDAIGERSTGG